ncbi:hypothetical protein BDR04DRAFT_1016832 [Suillus decipiens]|nr:hypothetical protein BDR04DRAFT_1016832 [Suillus decipiens]
MQHEIWIANKYVSNPSTDSGKTRIPVLQVKNPDSTICEAISNDNKSEILARTFFPHPPPTSSVPKDFEYPDPATPFTPITMEHIEQAISNTSPYKAPGPDRLCNIIFKCNSGQLTPYLLYIFRAVFTLKTYYEPWRDFTTVVLHKPGKADYSAPKAY